MDIQDYGKVTSRNLKRIIYESGKTQTEVAKALGINKSTLSSWMNGTRVPRMNKIDMLCKYFGCTRSDIMEEHPIGEPVHRPTDEMSCALQELIEAAAGCTPEQIKTAVILLNTLKGGLK